MILTRCECDQRKVGRGTAQAWRSQVLPEPRHKAVTVAQESDRASRTPQPTPALHGLARGLAIAGLSP